MFIILPNECNVWSLEDTALNIYLYQLIRIFNSKKYNEGFLGKGTYGSRFLGHRSQRLQWPIVITRCPASVRPSTVRRPLDNSIFQLLLQNRLMDFDKTWYGWRTQGPLQVLLFFGQIRPGADPGRGQIGHGVPFFKELLQTGRLQQQTKCIAVI